MCKRVGHHTQTIRRVQLSLGRFAQLLTCTLTFTKHTRTEPHLSSMPKHQAKDRYGNPFTAKLRRRKGVQPSPDECLFEHCSSKSVFGCFICQRHLCNEAVRRVCASLGTTTSINPDLAYAFDKRASTLGELQELDIDTLFKESREKVKAASERVRANKKTTEERIGKEKETLRKDLQERMDNYRRAVIHELSMYRSDTARDRKFVESLSPAEAPLLPQVHMMEWDELRSGNNKLEFEVGEGEDALNCCVEF